ncbi:hypothetical protein SFUMM280S_04324 [Streptomyces fumanus]
MGRVARGDRLLAESCRGGRRPVLSSKLYPCQEGPLSYLRLLRNGRIAAVWASQLLAVMGGRLYALAVMWLMLMQEWIHAPQPT